MYLLHLTLNGLFEHIFVVQCILFSYAKLLYLRFPIFLKRLSIFHLGLFQKLKLFQKKTKLANFLQQKKRWKTFFWKKKQRWKMENFFEKKKKDGRWKTFLEKKNLTDGKLKTKMTDGKVFDQWGEKKKKKTVRESKIAI